MPIFHVRVPLSGSLPLWSRTATASPLRSSTLPLTALLSLDHLFTTPAGSGDLPVVPISTAACVVPDPNAQPPRGGPLRRSFPQRGLATTRAPPGGSRQSPRSPRPHDRVLPRLY